MTPRELWLRVGALAIVLTGCSVPAPGSADRGLADREPADLVLRNGNVVTVDPQLGLARSVAVRGDRITAVGGIAAIDAMIGPQTVVIELDGATVIPGFIEGHGHFTGVGHARQILDLMQVRNWDEVIALVADAAAAAAPGEWIIGRGWHQEKWDRPPATQVEGFPTHDELSQVTPDNPVQLTHASGHAAFFNAKAMELAGIDRDTEDPPGGEILRDAQGFPIGVFRERAQGLVGRARTASELTRSPAQRRATMLEALRLAQQECLAKGVTSFQDAGSTFSTVDMMREFAEAGELQIRLYVMIRDSNARLAKMLPDYRMVGAFDNRLTVRAVKRSIDGALGPRGAWLLEPYSDAPNSSGLETATVESVTETARIAARHEFQVCVHAIGDRANREVLDIYQATLAAHPGIDDPRWRIEHAQHIHPDDIPRFAELGVIASMQGVHCTSDAPYVIARLGEQRARTGAYVWRSLIDSGATVTNGTDAPVEKVDPLVSFHSSVTRRLANGSRFFPEQCMSRDEALASYTIECARAAFEEHDKGSLTPGKLADLVVLSKDIMTVPADEILDAEVLHTVLGGKIVHSK